jgi:hypothetical protein
MKRLALLLFFVAACGDDSSGDAPDANVSDPDPDFDDTAATVEVQQQVYEGGGGTSITASLIVEDPIWPYTVEEPVGACRFSTRTPQDCGFDCQGVCVGSVCEPLPVAQDAGELTVTTGAATRTVPFGKAGYAHYEQALVFAPGTTLTVSAPGADVAGFELSAQVPESLELTNQDELRLEVGVPLVLRWEPDDPGSRVRVVLGADLGHARYRSALIECDVPDEDGQVAIPQELVDRLADPELWSCGDCFSQSMKRYYRARGAAGDLELTLWSTEIESPYLSPPP